MSNTMHTNPKTFQFRIRSLLLLTLVVAALSKTVVWIVPNVQEARETARHTQCTNNLFHHSGYHPPVIQLDKDLQVVRVDASCPSCVWHVSPVYRIIETGTVVDCEAVPEASLSRVGELLAEIKKTEPYRRFKWSSTEMTDDR